MSETAQLDTGTPALIGAGCGIGAAALFGASAPFSKLLLVHIGPILLASLLYLGAALALGLLKITKWRRKEREARLRGTDFLTLGAITILGGIAGPLLMLYGLERISALAGSLILNLEAPFTVLIAICAFREYLGAREVLAMAAILLGVILLGWAPGAFHADPIGAGAIAAACLCWGIDNNLSQRLSLRDPAVIANIKALGAGLTTLALAYIIGAPAPRFGLVLAALILGAFCYGMSIYLDIWALRILGAAREAAYFASAPFLGAIISLAIFPEVPRASEWIAAALMALGVALLMREKHAHLH
ncbi:MAG: DMT family transporter, partial [Candidatus Binataceae bacterium]